MPDVVRWVPIWVLVVINARFLVQVIVIGIGHGIIEVEQVVHVILFLVVPVIVVVVVVMMVFLAPHVVIVVVMVVVEAVAVPLLTRVRLWSLLLLLLGRRCALFLFHGLLFPLVLVVGWWVEGSLFFLTGAPWLLRLRDWGGFVLELIFVESVRLGDIFWGGFGRWLDLLLMTVPWFLLLVWEFFERPDFSLIFRVRA